ncbi:alpha/beta fold hydrolase [Paenibacillus sp. CAU 1782]
MSQSPTLTIVSEHWAETASAYTKALTPKSAVEVLGGHLSFWEHAEKFNEIVARFLGGNEGSAEVAASSVD